MKSNSDLHWSSLNGISSKDARSSHIYLLYCPDGNHYWSSRWSNFLKGKGCPHCYGGRFLSGVNDVATRASALLSEWSFENDSSPAETHYLSTAKVQWECALGHSWSDSPARRVRGSRCPICTEFDVEVESLQYSHPDVFRDLVNGPGKSTCVVAGSNMEAWFECPRGHRETQSVVRRVQGGCRSCSSILYSHPSLAQRLLIPEEALRIRAGSNRMRQWRCEQGHHYEMTPKNAVRSSGSCPVCSGKQVRSGVNDLASLRPELCEYYSSKNEIPPEKVFFRSTVDRGWDCPRCSNEWVISPARFYGCPKCAPKHRSRLELEVIEFLRSTGEDGFVSCYTGVPGIREVDLFFPDSNRGIEIQGSYWHGDECVRKRTGKSAVEVHSFKRKTCENNGIQLSFLWEDDWHDRGERIRSELLGFVRSGHIGNMLRRLR